MTKILFFLLSCTFLLFYSCTTKEEIEGIKGLWYSTDQKSAEIRCLVAIYEYQDIYYGKILVTYDEEGNVSDTILKQKDRAPGIVGNPPYCGLDFIYNVKENGTDKYGNPKYKGKIVDPEKGKEYKVELWLDGDDLIVRGELWIFGKNIRWFRAPKDALPKGFSLKEIKKFVPEVPQTN
ncbi:MAG TPA: DUF2147 domain-containing protein [Rhabdochlamydiaceae bacterium]|jgi:uncharacterized protein (DUF2147 family)